MFPTGSTQPATSSLNASAGEIISTTQVVRPGPDGRVSVHNPAGNVHVVVEVHGYFTAGDVIVTLHGWFNRPSTA